MQNQIISARDVFNYCTAEIKNIKVYFIPKEKIDVIRTQLKEWYTTTNTLPGTCSFHHYIPLSSSVVGAKRVK